PVTDDDASLDLLLDEIDDATREAAGPLTSTSAAPRGKHVTTTANPSRPTIHTSATLITLLIVSVLAMSAFFGGMPSSHEQPPPPPLIASFPHHPHRHVPSLWGSPAVSHPAGAASHPRPPPPSTSKPTGTLTTMFGNALARVADGIGCLEKGLAMLENDGQRRAIAADAAWLALPPAPEGYKGVMALEPAGIRRWHLRIERTLIAALKAAAGNARRVVGWMKACVMTARAIVVG
ncbi:hypothetical protein HK101_006579, partial [Irineochytrium annulatum]